MIYKRSFLWECNKIWKKLNNNLAISCFLEGLERDLQRVKRKGLKLVSPRFHGVYVAHWKLGLDRTFSLKECGTMQKANRDAIKFN